MTSLRCIGGVLACAALGCGSAGSSGTPGTPSGATAPPDGGSLGPNHVISHGGGWGAAPSPAAPPETTPNQEARIACPSPRLSVCTKQFQPVCGEVDTGVRCIQAPCPSSERRTFGNACEACADPKVTGYAPGACPGAP